MARIATRVEDQEIWPLPKTKTLCQANLMAEVQRVLLFDTIKDYTIAENPDAPVEVLALASYAKNHGRNSKNVANLIQLLWPSSECKARPIVEDPDGDGFFRMIVDITFPDGSHGAMFAMDNGVFEEYQTFGWSDVSES